MEFRTMEMSPSMWPPVIKFASLSTCQRITESETKLNLYFWLLRNYSKGPNCEPHNVC
jgi:hypothetical protein